MPITWRPVTAADLIPCLALQPGQRGAGLVGEEAALVVWRRLQRDPLFIGAVFEANPTIRGHRLVCFGASVFVSSAFTDAEIANPRCDINSRVIASVHAGEPVVLTREQIARANAGVGLDSVILYGVWSEEIMTPDQAAEARTAVPTAFIQLQAGYRTRRFLWESASQPQERFARMSGFIAPSGSSPKLAGRCTFVAAKTPSVYRPLWRMFCSDTLSRCSVCTSRTSSCFGRRKAEPRTWNWPRPSD